MEIKISALPSIVTPSISDIFKGNKMITEQALMPQIEMVDPINKVVRINMATSIIKDEIEISRINNYQSFQPGQLDEVRQFIGVDKGPEVDYITAIWS